MNSPTWSYDFWGDFAGLLGGTAAVLTDPVVLVSLILTAAVVPKWGWKLLATVFVSGALGWWISQRNSEWTGIPAAELFGRSFAPRLVAALLIAEVVIGAQAIIRAAKKKA